MVALKGQNMNDDWNLINAKEVAQILHIAPSTINGWIYHNRMPFPVYKIGTRTLRFKKTDVVAYLERIKNEQA